MLPDVTSADLAIGLGVALVTTSLVVEWNNRASLLRIRSRFTSSAWILLLGIFPALHAFTPEMLAVPALLVSYLLLFLSHQNDKAEGFVFHAFLTLSLGSLVVPPLLYLAVAFWLYMIFFLRNFTLRTLCASIFGILLPWIYRIAYGFYEGDGESVCEEILSDFVLSLPDYGALPLWGIGAYAFALLTGIPAIFHFLRIAGADKRRTVVFFSIIIAQEILFLVILPLQPQLFQALFPCLLLTSAPLLAHHFALAKGKGADRWFIAVLTAGFLLGVANYLDLWSRLSHF